MEPNIEQDIPDEFVYKHNSNTILYPDILEKLEQKNIKKIIFGNKFNQKCVTYTTKCNHSRIW